MLHRPVAGRLSAALFAVAATAALAAPAAAKFTPVDGASLFSKTGPKIQDFPLPGGRLGYLLQTMRSTVLITDPKRVVLIMTYNGIDDATWPYHRVLAKVLKAACGLEGKTAARLIASTYKSKSVTPPRRLGGNGGTLVKRRQTVVMNGCRITVEVDGARWHRLTTTIRRA
jgi:hypothetical protein